MSNVVKILLIATLVIIGGMALFGFSRGLVNTLFLPNRENRSLKKSTDVVSLDEVDGGFFISKPLKAGKFPLYRLLRTDWNADGTDDVLLVDIIERSPLVPGLLKLRVSILAGDLSKQELFECFGSMNMISAADMNGDGLPELCSGANWTTTPKVYDRQGENILIDAPWQMGVTSAVIADAREDGHGFLILGMNGDNGLKALNIRGEVVFEDKMDLGNVWSVNAGDIDGDSNVEIVNSSASGNLEVWSSGFQHLRTLKPDLYTGSFCLIDYNGDGASEILLSQADLINGKGKLLHRGDSVGLDPRFAASADIATIPGLETAWTDYLPATVIEIRDAAWKPIYRFQFDSPICGLVSTAGIPGWEPGFLVLVGDDKLLLYTKKP